MKTVIFAGGKGTRLHDVTRDAIPKPMVPIGGKPILQRIMEIYSIQGHRDFIIAAGHKYEVIDEWVVNNHAELEMIATSIVVIDTGENTQTGGRLKRLGETGYLDKNEDFFLTYGDGLGNINLRALSVFHNILLRSNPDTAITLTAVNPPARFGVLELRKGFAVKFGEKRQSENSFINGGFYLVKGGTLELFEDDDCRLEFDVLPSMAQQGLLGAYNHTSYWQMMDTPRNLRQLERDYIAGQPWLEGLEKRDA